MRRKSECFRCLSVSLSVCPSAMLKFSLLLSCEIKDGAVDTEKRKGKWFSAQTATDVNNHEDDDGKDDDDDSDDDDDDE